MLILDSNHLRVLRTSGPASERLEAKLVSDGRDVVTTVVNVHEGINGYLAEIQSARDNSQAKAAAYANLQEMLEYYCDWSVLPFDSQTAGQFDQLRHLPNLRNVGTMDLQIAAIALCHKATVLTSNLPHFNRVPNLDVQDWLLDDPVEEMTW